MAVIKSSRSMRCNVSALTKEALEEFLAPLDPKAHITILFREGGGQRGVENHVEFIASL